MKIYKKLVISCLVFLAFGGSAQAANLSQTNVSLSQGQSSTVYASNVSTFLYLSNNSNSNVATVSIGGNTISIYANSTGSTTATICENNANNCNNIYIVVNSNNNGNSGALSLSQTNLSLSVGQTSNITAYNNYGTLYISNNSNQNIATASASGNSVSIYANSIGSTNITICQSGNTSSCGTVYVNVIGGYGYNPINALVNTLGLNISSLNFSVGDSMTVSSANSNLGGLYVSSNSNPGVVSTSYSSLTLGCYGNSQYSILTGQPCYGGIGYSNNYNGGSTGYSSVPGCYGNSQYSILTGQYCYGGGYGSTNTNNTSLVISAVSIGSDMLTLCQNNGNACNTLYISVIR
jgi:hypothetical protein